MEWSKVYEMARIAGKAAADRCTPTPMIVSQHKDMLDDTSPVTKQYFVPQGVCGFAWITIRPGNCQFANWLKKNHLARPAYGGGVQIWVSDYDQSYELKLAYAGAFADVLAHAGIKAYAGGRLD